MRSPHSRRAFLSALSPVRAVVASAQPGPTDVQILQTAASIENLLVSTYDDVLKLTVVSAGPPIVNQFLTAARGHHVEHAKAFNERVVALRGAAQPGPDPALLAQANERKLRIVTLLDAVNLGMFLETIAAHTHAKNTELLSDSAALRVVTGTTGIEAQHLAVLATMASLLVTRPEQLGAFPKLDLGGLAPETGRVGFPTAVLATSEARPGDEGAHK